MYGQCIFEYGHATPPSSLITRSHVTHTCSLFLLHTLTLTLITKTEQFLKDLTLQFRAVGTNVCQLLTPIIFILFVGIMQVIVNFILRDHHYPVPGTETPYLPPVNPGRLLDCRYVNV